MERGPRRKLMVIVVVIVVLLGLVAVYFVLASSLGPQASKPVVRLSQPAIDASYDWVVSTGYRDYWSSATFSVTTAAPTQRASLFRLGLEVNGTRGSLAELPGAWCGGSLFGAYNETDYCMSLKAGALNLSVKWGDVGSTGKIAPGDIFTVDQRATPAPFIGNFTIALLWTDGSQVASLSLSWPPVWRLGYDNNFFNPPGVDFIVGVAFPAYSPADLDVGLQVNAVSSSVLPLPTVPKTPVMLAVGTANYTVTWQDSSASGLVQADDHFVLTFPGPGFPNATVIKLNVYLKEGGNLATGCFGYSC